jgi:hypothetical protein
LQEYTRLKRAEKPADLSWRLVLDAMLFQAEAEVRWLDHCEASLARYSAPRLAAAVPDDGEAVPDDDEAPARWTRPRSC